MTNILFKRVMGVFVIISVFLLSFSVVDAKKVEGERFVAHGETEVKIAVDAGCSILRETRGMTSLVCPEDAGLKAGLKKDIPIQGTDTFANAQVGANLAHDQGIYGDGQVVVILDTGIDYNHAALSKNYIGGKDFFNFDDDPMDDNGHGTHIAGLLAGADNIASRDSEGDAKTNSGNAYGKDKSRKKVEATGMLVGSEILIEGAEKGITNLRTTRGVAPGAKIVAGKVLNQNKQGYLSDLVSGIYWAVNGTDGKGFGATAISISISTTSPYLYTGICDDNFPDIKAAIDYARSNGVVVVVATGNTGVNGIGVPGCISSSLTVGAVDETDKVTTFSGKGAGLDIVAPGLTLYSTWLNQGTNILSGTSMATPIVTGAVLLVKEAHPEYSVDQIEQAILSNAIDLGVQGYDTSAGWGRLDIFSAIFNGI